MCVSEGPPLRFAGDLPIKNMLGLLLCSPPDVVDYA